MIMKILCLQPLKIVLYMNCKHCAVLCSVRVEIVISLNEIVISLNEIDLRLKTDPSLILRF